MMSKFISDTMLLITCFFAFSIIPFFNFGGPYTCPFSLYKDLESIGSPIQTDLLCPQVHLELKNINTDVKGEYFSYQKWKAWLFSWVVSKLRSAEVEEKIEYSEYTIPLKWIIPIPSVSLNNRCVIQHDWFLALSRSLCKFWIICLWHHIVPYM
jgi:hypothetical protein